MSFFTRKRKRPRPSSTADEVCTSWYSTDPKDLPPGFTVGSMSCPYPPPYYNPQSTEKHKKKRGKKSKSRKPPKEQRKAVHDFRPLQKSRLVGLDGEIQQEEGDGTGAAATACSPPLTNNAHDPTIPADSAATATEKGEPLAKAKPQVDSQRENTNQNGNHEEVEKPQVVQEEVNDNPKEKRLSNRLTLLRSCSVDNIDVLYRGHENPSQIQPQKSSKEVEDIGKSRGISVGDDQKVNQSGSVRPYQTRQPRSQPIRRHQRIVSEIQNLSALGSSPDLLKKQSSASFQTISKKTLYKPRSAEVLIETIRTGVDVNTLDESGNAPIHAIVTGKKRKDKVELLLALLIYSKVDINLPNIKQMTALHLAVEDGDEMCIRALLTFGANISAEGRNQFTPLDLATNKDTIREIETILTRMGAKTSSRLIREASPIHSSVPRLYSFAENMKPPPINEQSSRLMRDVQSELANQRAVMEMYRDLEVKLNHKFSLSVSHSEADESPEEAFALLMQQRELNRFNKTLEKSGIGVFSGMEGGSRILFLDGGGIKGLVQLEVLMQLEAKTGRKITELFDWIVGTSTGGVIALTLVYGKKSLREIFQLYFMMKDRIFSKSRIGFGFNTEALEEILQEYLDPDIKMTDVTHPKVLISAVNKATTNLELHFFNNCFGDEYMDYPVWKVARYTSATPMFFSECDNYIDGGVICNNPTEYGLTAIQNFFRQQGKRLPIALVVSIGTGVYPAEELGSIDLFLGIQTLTRIKQRTQNLISLLGNALVESEMVATNSQSRCREQGIPFFRFSPKLRDVIAGSETDNEKLFNMVIQTRIDTREQGMEELVHLFHTIAGASHHLAPRIEEERVIEREEQCEKHDHRHQRVREEKPELNANLNDRRGLLKASPPSSSSQPMLSDIEETVEDSTKKSYKSPSMPRQPSALATFVVGELDAPGTAQVSTQTAAASRGNESETDGPMAKQEVRSESTNTSVLDGEKSEQEVDTFSNQSVAERESQVHEESPQNENDATHVQSQNSPVFSAELASPSEVQTSLPQEKENDDDRLNTKSQESPDSQHSEHVNALHDVTSPLEDQRKPPGAEELKEWEKDLSSNDRPSVPERTSQETHESTSDEVSSLAAAYQPSSSSSSRQEGSSISHDWVITLEKFAGEEKRDVCSNQMKQKDLDKTKEERSDSAINGGSVIGVTIPMGSSHSSFISLESPQISGPPKKKIPRTANDERDLPNGDTHFMPLPSIPSTAAEQFSNEIHSTAGLVNGCISHTQVPKLENGTKEREEVPNHYKLNVQLTPEKFPYRFETEI